MYLLGNLPFFNTLEKKIAIHSSILAWKIPWMKQPGGLQSMGSQRVRHNWATSLEKYVFRSSGEGPLLNDLRQLPVLPLPVDDTSASWFCLHLEGEHSVCSSLRDPMCPASLPILCSRLSTVAPGHAVAGGRQDTRAVQIDPGLCGQYLQHVSYLSHSLCWLTEILLHWTWWVKWNMTKII